MPVCSYDNAARPRGRYNQESTQFARALSASELSSAVAVFSCASPPFRFISRSLVLRGGTVTAGFLSVRDCNARDRPVPDSVSGDLQCTGPLLCVPLSDMFVYTLAVVWLGGLAQIGGGEEKGKSAMHIVLCI